MIKIKTHTNCFRGYSIILFQLVVALFLISCETKAVETVDKVNKLLANGQHLVIEKTNVESTTFGIFTGNKYGTKHSYKYSVKITQKSAIWEGGSAEPKSIIFCEDTIFIHSLKEKRIYTQHIDTATNDTLSSSHYETLQVFEKYVDKRYLFNLFGDHYWVEIPKEKYKAKKVKCTEYSIPNDNELSI